MHTKNMKYIKKNIEHREVIHFIINIKIYILHNLKISKH